LLPAEIEPCGACGRRNRLVRGDRGASRAHCHQSIVPVVALVAEALPPGHHRALPPGPPEATVHALAMAIYQPERVNGTRCGLAVRDSNPHHRVVSVNEVNGRVVAERALTCPHCLHLLGERS
jgi:hypothetical protein